MPSKSKSQQRFFGMVDAYKKGEMKNASSKIKKAADGMSMKDVKDFAETKHNGLPEKVEERKNMNKKPLIRLTESDLHKIVKESVSKILKESKGTMPRKNAEIVGRLDSTLPQGATSDLGYVHHGSHDIDGDIGAYIDRIKQGLAMIKSGIAGAAERNGVWEKDKYQPMVDSVVNKVSFIISNLRKNAYMLNDQDPWEENEYSPYQY